MNSIPISIILAFVLGFALSAMIGGVLILANGGIELTIT